MRALILFALAVGEHAAAISEKERAEADALAVLSSVLKTLESASNTAQLLDSRFSAWCENALLSQRSFAEEVQREMAEAETSVEQVTADEDRLQSETRLSSATITAADQDQVSASSAKNKMVEDGKEETSLLERANELTTHALRLVANRRTLPTVDETGGAVDAGALQSLLEDLQQEVEQQRLAVQQEQEAAATLSANSSAQASLAGSALLAEKNAMGIEGRERERAKARFSSVSSDLRRLLLAIDKAVNVTQKVCDAEEVSVRGEDGVADAEMDAVHAVLDQVSPDLNAPAFTQLFLERRAAAKQSGIGSQFRDFALRMSRQSKFSSPAFLAAVQQLTANKASLVSESAVKSGGTETTSALAEIADFAKPENDDVEVSAAKSAYRQLTAQLKREISGTIALGLECAGASSNASADVRLRQHEASLADAQLYALNMTTTDMSKTADYLTSQLKSLRSDAAQFADLVKLELSDHEKLGTDLHSFTQQMVSVATEITGVGEKKVGRELEQLVERLQGHLNAVNQRHATYLQWKQAIDKGIASLERVLAVDLGHAKHKLQSYATDTVFLAAMERAKKRDEVTANEQLAKAVARCPEDQEAVRRTKQAALEEQLREVTSYWTSLRI